MKTALPVNPRKAKKFKTPQGLFTVAEIAYQLGCHPQTVVKYFKNNGDDWHEVLTNRVTKMYIEYRGEKYTVSQLCDKLDILLETLYQLINTNRRFKKYETDELAIDAFIERSLNRPVSIGSINAKLNRNQIKQNVQKDFARCTARHNL